jgi:hypothetical protein
MFEAVVPIFVMQVNFTSDGVGSGGIVPHFCVCSEVYALFLSRMNYSH